jgi:hypothetical protein
MTMKAIRKYTLLFLSSMLVSGLIAVAVMPGIYPRHKRMKSCAEYP